MRLNDLPYTSLRVMSAGRNVYATILNPNNLWEMKVAKVAQYLYSYYEKVSSKSCTNRLLEAFVDTRDFALFLF